MKVIKGTYYRIDIEGLGEFRFVATEDKYNGYFLESFWNPPNYGSIYFIVGYYCSDVDEEIKRISEDMDYFRELFL